MSPSPTTPSHTKTFINNSWAHTPWVSLSMRERDCLTAKVFQSVCFFAHSSSLSMQQTHFCMHQERFHEPSEFCVVCLVEPRQPQCLLLCVSLWRRGVVTKRADKRDFCSKSHFLVVAVYLIATTCLPNAKSREDYWMLVCVCKNYERKHRQGYWLAERHTESFLTKVLEWHTDPSAICSRKMMRSKSESERG